MPRSKKQYENMIQERCEHIIKAALKVFALKGYNAVGMDDVAKEANCSRALIYHYYPTKDELFKKLMKQVAFKIHSITESVDYNQTADKAMNELLMKVLEKIDDNENNCAYACMFYLILNLHLQGGNIPKPPQRSKDTPIGKKRMYQIVTYLIEKGQKEKIFKNGDSKKYAITILTILNGLAYNKIFLKDKFIYPDSEIMMRIIMEENK